jgi:hypothetical protein
MLPPESVCVQLECALSMNLRQLERPCGFLATSAWIKEHWQLTAYELPESLSVGCSSRISSMATAIRFDFR